MRMTTKILEKRMISAFLFAFLFGIATAGPALALDLRNHGPTFALGYARTQGKDMAVPSLGWRWQFGCGDFVDSTLVRVGARLTWFAEPMAAAIIGDEDSAELQIVPGLRAEPISPWGDSAAPYLEGGIGLMYTGLDGLGLGSNILFSDNVGVGITFRQSGWSIGYRYRHASHAGLWADSNAGLDVHYLTARYDIH